MKSFRFISVIVSGVLGLAVRAPADMIFDVTFENPPHVAGELVTAGSGTDRPYEAYGFMVSNLTSFGSQAAVVYYAPDLFAGMGFFPATWQTTGIHTISWDLSLLQGESIGTVEIFGLSPYITVNYGGGTISIYDGLHGMTNCATYILGSVDNYELVIDLESDTYNFSIGGTNILTDRSLSEGNIQSAVFYRQFGDAIYAVDNFQWSVIPEPGTIGLLGLGGLALWFFNPWKKRRTNFQ